MQWLVNAGCIKEDNLADRLRAVCLTACLPDDLFHPDDAVSGRLRFIRNDRELLAHQVIEQRGLAGVGPADQRDQARLHLPPEPPLAATTGSSRLMRTRVMRRCCVSTISTSRP